MKTVILVIVEGESDSEALYPWLKKIGKEFNILFEITHGDVFTKKENKGKSPRNVIGSEIAKFKQKSKIRDENILAVFQLTDTDGVFISDENIVIDQSVTKLQYTDSQILVKDTAHQDQTRKRNDQKRTFLIALSRTAKIKKSIYQIYYFSRNLEEITHNNPNLSEDDKVSEAENFSDSFVSVIEFEKFFNNKEFAVEGDYQQTWEFITKKCNSLNRYSNFHLLFASMKSMLEERDHGTNRLK